MMFNFKDKIQRDLNLFEKNLDLPLTKLEDFDIKGETILFFDSEYQNLASLLLMKKEISPFFFLENEEGKKKIILEYLSFFFPQEKIKLFSSLENILKTLEIFEEDNLEKSFQRDACSINISSPREANLIFFHCKELVRPDGEIIFFTPTEEHKRLWKSYVKSELIVESQEEKEKEKGYFKGKFNLPILKICIASLSVGEKYKKIVEPGIITKKVYCKRHNYFFREDEDIFDTTRPPAWSKVKLILKCLEEDYDYVVWIDSDTLIQNFRKRIEEFIFSFQGKKDILMTKDFHMLNSGVIFIKNTKWAKDFFNQVYAQVQFIHDPNWEQTAIQYLLEDSKISEHVRVLEPYQQREFNSYYCNFQKGDFLIHFPGCFRLGANNGLDDMMRRLYPFRKEEDTEESFRCRRELIASLNKK